MNKKLIQVAVCLAAFAVSAAAQTNVTNSNNGTTNTVPVYTGSATLGNSPIAVSGGNVGIGITSPDLPLVAGGAGGGQKVELNDISTARWSLGTGNYMLHIANDYPSAWTDRFVITQSGNVGVGTTSPGATLEVNGSMKLTASSGGSITFQDGTTQTTAYTGTTCGGDYAESMDVSGEGAKYAPGDVLVLDTDNAGKILKSIEPYSTAVAGIYSTKPGTVGRRQLTPHTDTEVPMAMLGVVPTKVTAENGAIHIGDLLVSSSKPGYAMKGTDRSRMLGAVIGKAMGTLDSGTGTVEVLVTLQ